MGHQEKTESKGVHTSIVAPNKPSEARTNISSKLARGVRLDLMVMLPCREAPYCNFSERVCQTAKWGFTKLVIDITRLVKLRNLQKYE
jgi:hypothetical protein